MRCSRCGANVVEGDRFCENCGAPVAVQAGSVCPVCGQQSEPGMRFCQQCGAELSAGPQSAQPRRHRAGRHRIVPRTAEQPDKAVQEAPAGRSAPAAQTAAE